VHRRLTACLAVLLLLVLPYAGFWHHHQNSESSATCQVCHAVHAPVVQPGIAPAIPAPLEIREAAPVAGLCSKLAPAGYQTSPRAPPSA
jgi:hypothetical protein